MTKALIALPTETNGLQCQTFLLPSSKVYRKKDGGEKLQFFINFNDRFDSGGQYLLSKDGLGFLKVQQQQQSLPKEMMLCSSVILTNIAFHFSSSSKGDLPQGKL